MKGKRKIKATARILTVALTLLLIFATTLSAHSTTINQSAEYIKQINNVSLNNLKDYLNPNAIFELPSTVAPDDDVSVIIKLSTPTLLDVYNKTDKSMTFAEFSMSEAADDVRKDIDKEIDKIRAELPEREASEEEQVFTEAAEEAYEVHRPYRRSRFINRN
jgi:hypothetical protein